MELTRSDCDTQFHQFKPNSIFEPCILLKGAPEDVHIRSLKPLPQIDSHLRRLMHIHQLAQLPLTHIGPTVTAWVSPSFTQSNSSNQSEICLRPETSTAQSPTSRISFNHPSVPAALPFSWFVLNFLPLDVSISMILTVLAKPCYAALLHSSHTPTLFPPPLKFCPLMCVPGIPTIPRICIQHVLHCGFIYTALPELWELCQLLKLQLQGHRI